MTKISGFTCSKTDGKTAETGREILFRCFLPVLFGGKTVVAILHLRCNSFCYQLASKPVLNIINSFIEVQLFRIIFKQTHLHSNRDHMTEPDTD